MEERVKISFTTLPNDKKLLLYTPVPPPDDDSQSSASGPKPDCLDCPRLIYLIHSSLSGGSAEGWETYDEQGEPLDLAIDGASLEKQELAHDSSHEYVYVGRMPPGSVIYEHKDSFYKSSGSNSIFSNSRRSIQYDVVMKKPGPPKLDIEDQLCREKWNNKAQYMLSCVAFAIGLGNIWRFPWLCQKYGGGAFLLAYVTSFFFIGLPLFVLEVAVGQRMQRGPLLVWAAVSPIAAGIGVCCVLVSFINSVYYSIVVSWCLYYSLKAFGFPAPWDNCDDLRDKQDALEECQRSGSVRYFWYRSTLNISPSIDTDVHFSFKISAMIIFAWAIIFLSLNKGIRRSGRLSYFTAIFPYFVLLVFLIRGLTLPGFEDGLKRMFFADMSKLTDVLLWVEASVQIVFSLSIGFGGYMAFSSYMPLNNNCYVDCILIGFINCFTSLLVGVVIFSILGYYANTELEECLARGNATGCHLDKFLEQSVQGTGIAFIAFTKAMNSFGSISPLFSALFFLMLVTLGIGSMFGTLQGVLTSMYDALIKNSVTSKIISISTCLIALLVSQLFSMTNGEYIMQMFDMYAVTLPLLIITFSELIAINWYIGVTVIADDIQTMCGKRPCFFFLLCWRYITPFLMLVLFIGSVGSIIYKGGVRYSRWNSQLAVTEEDIFPVWAQVACGCLSLFSTIAIPVIALLTKTGWCEVHFNFEEEDFVNLNHLRKLRIRNKVDDYKPSYITRLLFYRTWFNNTGGSFGFETNLPPPVHVTENGSSKNAGSSRVSWNEQDTISTHAIEAEISEQGRLQVRMQINTPADPDHPRLVVSDAL